ncbi:MAG TPA: hypothetical protein VLA24_17880 [Pseudomonadales bacterium]|nr:hypothetical protein [Pseudomonadales bacterium]
MITVKGMSEDTMTMVDVQKRIPSRLIRLLLRIASLRMGRYMILLNVGEDDISWSVADVGRIER